MVSDETKALNETLIRPDYADIAEAKRTYMEEARASMWSRDRTMTDLAVRAHGTAFRCASLNASVLAGVPVRLYRRAARGVTFIGQKTRKVDRKKTRDALRNPHRVGWKAADYAENAVDVVEVTDHPVLDLLRKPDPDTTGTAYQLAKYLSLQLFGNAFSVFSESGKASFLTALEAPYVNIEAGTDRLIESYTYSRNLANRVSFGAADTVHLKYMPSPTDPRWGVGPLHLVSAEMDLDDYAMVSEIARWQNGGMPGGVFSFKGASTQQIREAQQQHRQMYAGARNGGKDLFLTEATYTPLGQAKDMNYVEGMSLLERRILGAFRVPEAIFALNDANLASSVTANGMYMSLAIQPTIAAVCEQETEDLLPRFGIEPGEMWLAPDDVVPDDLEALRSRVSSYVPAGIMTINEARQEMGYEPIDGGDDLRINGVPLDEVASQSGLGMFGPVAEPSQPVPVSTSLDSQQVTLLVDLASKVGLGELPKESAIALALAAFPNVPPERITAIFGPIVDKPEPVEPQPAVDEPAPVDDEPQQEVLTLSKFRWPVEEACPCCTVEKDIAQDIARALGAEAVDELQLEIERYLNGIAATWDGGELSPQDNTELERLLAPVMESAYEAGVTMAADKTGMEPISSAENALEYVRRRSSLIIEEINGTTEDALRAALERNIEEGGTLTEAIGAIRESYPEMTGARAQMIARTELSNAVQSSEREQFLAMGIKTVSVLNGSRPTPTHVELAKMRQNWPIDEPIVTAGMVISAGGQTEVFKRTAYTAPFRPNCMCQVLPDLDGEAEL